jgi:hypothetical protein
MATMTAPTTKAISEIDTWNAATAYCTVDDEAKGMMEGVVSVMTSDENGVCEAVEMLAGHHATVRSGHGGRMIDVFGFQFRFKAPKEEFPGIRNAIEKKFSVTPPVSRQEDFPVIHKWIATHEVYFYKRIDDYGVLASVLVKLAEEGVNVVAIQAATGPGAPIGDKDFVYWGQATIGVHIDKNMSVDVVKAAVREIINAAGDRVDITPIVKKPIKGVVQESQTTVRNGVHGSRSH